MKNLIISILMLTPFIGYTDQQVLKPLWKEEEHFAKYRVFCIEGRLSALESMIKKAKDDPRKTKELLDQMELEVKNFRNFL